MGLMYGDSFLMETAVIILMESFSLSRLGRRASNK